MKWWINKLHNNYTVIISGHIDCTIKKKKCLTGHIFYFPKLKMIKSKTIAMECRKARNVYKDTIGKTSMYVEFITGLVWGICDNN